MQIEKRKTVPTKVAEYIHKEKTVRVEWPSADRQRDCPG